MVISLVWSLSAEENIIAGVNRRACVQHTESKLKTVDVYLSLVFHWLFNQQIMANETNAAHKNHLKNRLRKQGLRPKKKEEKAAHKSTKSRGQYVWYVRTDMVT